MIKRFINNTVGEKKKRKFGDADHIQSSSFETRIVRGKRKNAKVNKAESRPQRNVMLRFCLSSETNRIFEF